MKRAIFGLASAFALSTGAVACTLTMRTPVAAEPGGDVYRIAITGAS